MSIQSFINSPFNTSNATVPAIPAPALTIVNLKPGNVTGAIAEMPANPGGANIGKVNAIYDAAGNPLTLFVPAGTYNATLYLPVIPTDNDSNIGSMQAVVVNNATGNVVLSSSTESFIVSNVDYSVFVFDVEDLVTIPADITVRFEVWYSDATAQFAIANRVSPFSASEPWNPYLSLKSFKLPLVPPLSILP